MAIKRRKKRGRVYLEEYKSIRVDGKVKSVYLRNLGPEDPVAPSKPKPKTLDRLQHNRSHRAGAITLLWELASQLGFVNWKVSIHREQKKLEKAQYIVNTHLSF